MSFNIGKSKKEQRVLHWKEIQTRIKSHEGELLSGNKATKYRKNYDRIFGTELSRPTDFDKPEYQKELAKTK